MPGGQKSHLAEQLQELRRKCFSRSSIGSLPTASHKGVLHAFFYKCFPLSTLRILSEVFLLMNFTGLLLLQVSPIMWLQHFLGVSLQKYLLENPYTSSSESVPSKVHPEVFCKSLCSMCSFGSLLQKLLLEYSFRCNFQRSPPEMFFWGFLWKYFSSFSRTSVSLGFMSFSGSFPPEVLLHQLFQGWFFIRVYWFRAISKEVGQTISKEIFEEIFNGIIEEISEEITVEKKENRNSQINV